MTREEALYCMKANSVLHPEICEECPLYGDTGVDHCFEDALDEAIKALEQEPCDVPDINVGDMISRQAVLDAMYELCDTGETLKENPWRDNPHIDAVVETIEELPSVNPQPCEDAISRQAVLEYIEGSGAELGHSSENELVCQHIKEFPSVAPQPKTGHWVYGEDETGRDGWYCNRCRHFEFWNYRLDMKNAKLNLPNYCPNCGAKMVEPQENEDKKKLTWLGKRCEDCGNKKCKELGELPKGYDCALWQERK